jgi:hypothetical protein
VLEELSAAGLPFLVGGGHALERHLGIGRSVKDLDLFMRERDVPAALAHVGRRLGYRTEVTFPHWLAKIQRDGHDHIDVIWSSGNSACPVDDDCPPRAPATVMGRRFSLPGQRRSGPRLMMERERYDGADIAHLIHAGRADRLAARRFGQHWRVLLSHLILFGFVYPSERRRIPEPLMRRCLEILEQEMRQAPARRICRGPLTSRAQYLVDVQLWGYEDARLLPHGSMSEEDASIWTAAIDEAASRPIGADALAGPDGLGPSPDGACDARFARAVAAPSARRGPAPHLAAGRRRSVPACHGGGRPPHRRGEPPRGRAGLDRDPGGPGSRRLRPRVRRRHPDRRAGHAVHAALALSLRDRPAFVVMVVGSAMSAALAFLIARYLARDTLAERLAGTDGFARLSALVEEHDWVVIPVLRIVPIAPFAVVNYGFGLTGISFWRYFGWSELAMIPMNAVLVLGAGLVLDATTRGPPPGHCSAWPPPPLSPRPGRAGPEGARRG